MKSWKDKIDRVFAAITFAEAHEHETARAFIPRTSSTPLFDRELFRKINKIMAAVTFAEADCHDQAREIMGAAPRSKTKPAPSLVRDQSFAEAVGLAGIRIWYGTAEVA